MFPRRLAFTIARRELRGGLRGFRILLLCVALGVSAIAGVGSLSDALVDGLHRDGRLLLGGDVELRLSQQPASPQIGQLRRAGGLPARSVRLSKCAPWRVAWTDASGA